MKDTDLNRMSPTNPSPERSGNYEEDKTKKFIRAREDRGHQKQGPLNQQERCTYELRKKRGSMYRAYTDLHRWKVKLTQAPIPKLEDIFNILTLANENLVLSKGVFLGKLYA